jgi:hypothetical protein
MFDALTDSEHHGSSTSFVSQRREAGSAQKSESAECLGLAVMARRVLEWFGLAVLATDLVCLVTVRPTV